MATTDKSPKPVMDVSKPGKTAATASSRPVIVGHKSEIQDPMVTTAEDKNPEVPEVETPVVAQGKKVITPIGDQASEHEAVKPAEDTAEDATPQDSDTPDDGALPEENDVIVQEGDQGQHNADQDVNKQQQERFDTLVADKKYFVPIGKSQRRRKSRMTALLLVFIIIGLAGIAVIAIDAELIDIGVELPFTVMPK